MAREETFSKETLERIASTLRERGIRPAPVDEATVAAFETRCRIALPPGYRALLRSWGPHDLCALGEVPGDYGPHAVFERLAEPFPLTDVWNEDDQPSPAAAWDAINRGWMPITSAGCGQYSLLVCSGPQRGQVWCTSGTGVVGPEEPSEFLAWYEHQLAVPEDGPLAELNRLVAAMRR